MLNEIDTLLRKELDAHCYGEDRIRKLVHDGANVNAIDGEPIAFNAIYSDEKAGSGDKSYKNLEDFGLLHLLVKLGLDLNIATDTGWSLLYEAAICENPYAVWVLLKLGADQNTICIDGSPETAYQMASQWANHVEDYYDQHKVMDCGIVASLLKGASGKGAHELVSSKIEKFISVFPAEGDETGIITYRGSFKIENISGLSNEVIRDFNDLQKVSKMAHGSVRSGSQFRQQLTAFAREIKKCVPKEIRVTTCWMYDDIQLRDEGKVDTWRQTCAGKLEHEIICWNNDGTKTAGSLTRKLLEMFILKEKKVIHTRKE